VRRGRGGGEAEGGSLGEGRGGGRSTTARVGCPAEETRRGRSEGDGGREMRPRGRGHCSPGRRVMAGGVGIGDGVGRLATADTPGKIPLVNHPVAPDLVVCRVAHGYSRLRI
jgi:hypothetical protein